MAAYNAAANRFMRQIISLYRRNLSQQYRRFHSSTTIENPNISRKEILLWQLRASSVATCIVVSVYASYVFVTSDFDFGRTKRKFIMHWNCSFYGNTPSVRQNARFNSRFNVCLSDELKKELSKYFINLDMVKENGVRRTDVILFLESVGIDVNNHFVDKFISLGYGDSKESKKLSGCSLQEFAELIEILVLEQRTNSNSAFEEELVQKIKLLNSSKNFEEIYLPSDNFRFRNPLITDAAKSMANELQKYISEGMETSEESEIEYEIQRNLKFKEKLEELAKTRRLTDPERKRLNAIYDELSSLKEESNRQKHSKSILLSM